MFVDAGLRTMGEGILDDVMDVVVAMGILYSGEFRVWRAGKTLRKRLKIGTIKTPCENALVRIS